MEKKKNILIGALNWGLGHASRIIPIIEFLNSEKHNVIIIGNGMSLKLLKNKFPENKFYNISAPEMMYGHKKAINTLLAWCFIKQIINIPIERIKVKKIVDAEKIDIIISDTRPGIFSKKTKNIYITHQINVYTTAKENFIGNMLTKFHYYLIKKYDFCWVPDIFGENSLTGKMSHNHKLNNVKFIGILTRFNKSIEKSEYLYDSLSILSGPEPQRTIFEKILTKKMAATDKKSIIIRGIAGSNKREFYKNILLIDSCDDNELVEFISKSRLIICRSGYSSIMDLARLNRKALLVPTPGQPEQEYLAQRLHDKYGFDFCIQDNFTIPIQTNNNVATKNWFVNNNNNYIEILKTIL